LTSVEGQSPVPKNQVYLATTPPSPGTEPDPVRG
jgi:hypothetical protein